MDLSKNSTQSASQNASQNPAQNPAGTSISQSPVDHDSEAQNNSAPRETPLAKRIRRLWLDVRIQDFFGAIFFIPFCGSLIFIQRYVLGYAVENRDELRSMYKQLMKEKKAVLICSNHLTYVDSSILIYAFANHFSYAFNFRTLTWNLPAAEYSKNPFFRVVGFLSKCLFIDRKGFSSHAAYIEVCRRLLKKGEPVMIFPEGRRSRTGKFDDRKLAHGLGKIISQLPEVTVLCTYIRAKNQDGFSNFPKSRSIFRVEHELLTLYPSGEKREDINALTHQVAQKIKDLEIKYFSKNS